MKKFILFFIATLFVFQIQAKDNTWRVANKANFTSLSGSYFYNQNIGWVVGASRTFAKTIDGGITWTKFEDIPSTSSTFYCVQFLTKTLGFVGVSNNELIKTTDDGVTWTSMDIGGPDGGAVRSIYFVDENTGWALVSTSSHAEVRYTSDGGVTWTTQLTNNGDLEAMAFRSATQGVCVGGGSGRMDIYYTHNGQNWSKVTAVEGLPNVYTRLDLRAVTFNSNNEVFAVGWGSQAAGLQPSLILKSSNGGEDWQYMEQAVEDRQYVNLNAITVLSDSTLIAGGGAAYEGTVLIKSTDDGNTWHRVEAKYGTQIKTLSHVGSTIVAAGSGGGIIYSNDEGATWTMPEGIIPTTSLYALKKVGDNFIIAGGYDGMLIKSVDNGATWSAIFASDGVHCPTIKDISFVNENVGYIARYNRMVSKTVDGGETWTTVIPDTNTTGYTLYGVQFLDENTGFVVGKSGTGVSAFYKTTDGGATWSKLIGTFSDHLLSVYFTDYQHGVVCGRDLTVYYTNDGGNTWTAGTINGSPDPGADLNKVVFYDSQNGIAFGDVLLRTTDGGATWDYSALPSSAEMKSGVMESVDHWILAGSSEINETTDGGSSWTNIIDWNVFDNLQLYGIVSDSNNKLWVSSSSSEIYTTAPLVSVSDDEPGTTERFTLGQNYPNPIVKGKTENVTTIDFTLPQSMSDVPCELSLYNILGQKITTILNQVESSGTHSVRFNTNNLPAGLYFYRINAGNFSQVKKMVIIK